MTTPMDAFDARVAERLHELAAEHTPSYLADVQAMARTAPQRPAWRVGSWWLPDAGRRAARVGVLAAVIALLVLGAVALVLLAGLPRVPPPFGIARNGAVAYDDNQSIWLRDVSGAVRRLSNGSVREIRPAFSPDGTRLAFLRTSASRTAVVVARADGSDARVVAPGVEAMKEPPVRAPDSRRLAFGVLDTTTGQERSAIVIVDAGGGGASELLPAPLLNVEQPAWSPDGERLAFLGELPPGGTGYLYVAGVDGRNLVRISERPSDGAHGYFEVPRWSPDGSRIAVHYGQAGQGSRDILLLATDHEQEQVLAGTPLDEAQPAWSPDGTAIAYWEAGTGRTWVLVVRDLATDTTTRYATVSTTADTLAWTPDGSSIVAARCVRTGCALVLAARDRPAALPTILTDLATSSYDESYDLVHWSWQRLAP